MPELADVSPRDEPGQPAATFKPSDTTKQTYEVRPGTPYDPILPYRTKELAWYLDRKLVTWQEAEPRSSNGPRGSLSPRLAVN